MRVALALILALILISGVSAAEYWGEVVRVSDGDTVVVRFLGDRPPPKLNSPYKPKPNIRLRFSDSPETKKRDPRLPGQPYGQAAKKFTSKVLPIGTRIRLVTEDGNERDGFNRPLGVVYRGFLNVNLGLVAAGLAHTFPYPKINEAINCKTYRVFTPYVYAEVAARNFKKGIWADNGLQEYPQNYRRRTKDRPVTDLTLRQYSDLVIERLRNIEATCR